jgi:hypothetical protein
MPTRNQKQEIIKELKETALEITFHGKALRMAKETLPLTENELEIIEAYTSGKRFRDPFAYRMRLYDLAIRMDQELEKEDEPSHEPDTEPSGPGM